LARTDQTGLCLSALSDSDYVPVCVDVQVYYRVDFTQKSDDPFCKEEFTAMAELGAKSGGIKDQEARILKSLFRFNSLRVKDIMTPRTVVFALNENMKIHEVLEQHPDMIFSRIPLFKEGIDRITGYVMKDEILEASTRDEHGRMLSDLKREIHPVYEAMPLPALYDFLLNKREHLILVSDQYGGTSGIVTLEDVVETLLGMEIIDELDVNKDMRALAKSKWKNRINKIPDYNGFGDWYR